MEIIVIILLIAMVVVMYGIFQNLFGSSEEITVIEEIPSPPKDLKEVMAQMQSEKLFKQAISLTEQNNYTEALPILEQAANLGNVEAMCLLGDLYSEEKGVECDLQKSYEYYVQAAEKEFPKAQYKLGMLLFEKNDTHKAQLWIEKSAQNGYPEALEILKRMGINITPIRKDETILDSLDRGSNSIGNNSIENMRNRGLLSNVFVSTLLLGITLWIVFFMLGLLVLNSTNYDNYIYKNDSYIREEAAVIASITALIGSAVGLICMIIAYFKPKVSSFVYAIVIFLLAWVPTLVIFFINSGFSHEDDTMGFFGLTFVYIISLVIISMFIHLSKSKKPIIKF